MAASSSNGAGGKPKFTPESLVKKRSGMVAPPV
jgi:hypothetical protein